MQDFATCHKQYMLFDDLLLTNVTIEYLLHTNYIGPSVLVVPEIKYVNCSG